MAALKTVPTTQDVTAFLNGIEPEEKRRDGLALLELMREATGEAPVMWGSAIVGFGKYHYKSERSRQEGDWMLIGFSPRKQSLTLYLMDGVQQNGELLQKLGKHKLGGGCLYINRLSDVDQTVLAELIKTSFAQAKREKGG